MQINWWIVWIYIRCFLHNIWICSAKRVNKGLFSKPCGCCCCSYLFLVAGRTKKMPGLMLYLHLPSLTANKKCFTAKTHLHQAVYILCELWSKDIFSEHYDWNHLLTEVVWILIRLNIQKMVAKSLKTVALQWNVIGIKLWAENIGSHC